MPNITRVDWNDTVVKVKLEVAEKAAPEAGAERLLESANESVPRDTGELADSGFVDEGEGGAIVGYDSPYAIRQHEDQSLNHPDGGRAKWLERAAKEDAKDIGDEMADKVKGVF